MTIDPADKMSKKQKKKLRNPDQTWHQCIEFRVIEETRDYLERIAEELGAFNVSVDRESDCLNCIVQKNTWCRRSRRGHPPPETRFDFQICLQAQKLVFKLPEAFKEQEAAFLSLVSHLQKKYAFAK